MFITHKDLGKIIFVLSIVGITSIYFLSKTIDAEQILVNELTKDDIGEFVKVCGVVESKFTSKDGHVFFKINGNNSEIDVIFFDQSAEMFELNKIKNGQNICAEGFVEIYNKKLEIIGKSLY